MSVLVSMGALGVEGVFEPAAVTRAEALSRQIRRLSSATRTS